MTAELEKSEAFSLLQRTLAEQLTRDQMSLPTTNVFSGNKHALSRALTDSLGVSFAEPVLIVSDGIKKRSGCGDLTIDELIVQLMQSNQRFFHQLCLADILNCSPQDVHASVEAVASCVDYFKQFAPSAVLVVGSGSVTDVVKHSLFELGWNDIPLIVLPTALTVTAFTSHFAVLEEAGAKRTRLSRRVDVCHWFSPVLSSAPIEMSRAGYGDLLARFVAYGDWYLAWRFGVTERYDELAFRLMDAFSTDLRQRAADLKTWPVRESAIEDLSAILAMAGIAMSLSGETTPLSGYEHTISHAMDYLRLTSKRPLCWHGEQVALASLSSAETYDRLLSLEKIDLENIRPQSEDRIKRTIQQMLANAPYFGVGEGALTEEERKKEMEFMHGSISRATNVFTQDYLKKNELWLKARANVKNIEQQWSETRAHLRTLVISAAEMRSLLEKSGLPLTPEELSQPTSAFEYRWALRFSPFVRSRASLSDILFWLGEDPAVWALV